ncbi:MAG: Hpt domain-containing protein [Caldimonas sp.]
MTTRASPATNAGPQVDAAPTAAFDAERGLACFGGSLPAYRRALAQFVAYYTAHVVWAKPATPPDAGLSSDSMARELHSFAGACRTIGADRIGAEATEFMEALKSGAEADAPSSARWLSLQSNLERLLFAIRVMLEAAPDAAASAPQK